MNDNYDRYKEDFKSNLKAAGVPEGLIPPDSLIPPKSMLPPYSLFPKKSQINEYYHSDDLYFEK